MSYVQLSQELSEVRGLIQKLLNNSKNINGFDINEGDIEPLVLAVYNTNKNKTEKVPYSNLLNQKHFKGFYGSQTELTNSIPNPNSNDFAFISNEGEINFVLFNNNSWTNIFDYVNTHISDTETHVTSQEKTNWNNKVDKETNKGLSTNDYTTEEKQKLRDLANTVLNDTLTSTSVTEGLTANQGRVLKGLIDAINQLLTSDDTSLDELQEIVAYIKQNRSTLNALSISNIAGLQNTLSKLETAIATAETTAKNHAKALDDAIEIGTRNKLKLSQLNSYFRLRGNSKVIGNGFEKIFKCDNPNYWAIIPIANTTPLIPKNKKFTLSFEYRRNLENGLGFELTGTKATPTVIHGLKKLPENNTDNWKVFTETLTANYTDAYPFGGLSLWGVGEVRKITIVEGTKFTGLFPAPEDIQAEIDNKSKLIIGDNNAIPKFELSGENKQLNFDEYFEFDAVAKKINLKSLFIKPFRKLDLRAAGQIQSSIPLTNSTFEFISDKSDKIFDNPQGNYTDISMLTGFFWKNKYWNNGAGENPSSVVIELMLSLEHKIDLVFKNNTTSVEVNNITLVKYIYSHIGTGASKHLFNVNIFCSQILSTSNNGALEFSKTIYNDGVLTPNTVTEIWKVVNNTGLDTFLKNIDFKIKSKISINYTDATNTNNNNAQVKHLQIYFGRINNDFLTA